jgi:hypothetical protein
MGKCIYKSGSQACGLQTAPLSQYCDRHQQGTGDELTLRAPYPQGWDDEAHVGESPKGPPDSDSKIG